MRGEEIDVLWAAFRAGDQDAFSRLFLVFYPQLYRYGLKLTPHEETVKDVIQDTFLYLFEKKEGLAQEINNVRSYLFTVFRRNLLRKRQQQQKEQGHRTDLALSPAVPFTIGTDDILIREESATANKELVVRLLNELPARQREILYLKFYQGQSMGEIAETLAITYQTAANQLYRGLKKLRANEHIRNFFKTALLFVCHQLH